MMKYDYIPGVGKPISRLVQGTVMINSQELEKGFKLLDEIFELDCTTFDTGHIYGNGDNERSVGRWVNERGIRDKVVIIGKGAHQTQDRKRVHPFDISAHIYDSLARFKFDYIDMYILHRDDPAVPVGAIVETLNEHVRAGHIHAFGGSNWSHHRIQAANKYAEAHGLLPFVVSSSNLSLAIRMKEPWPGCLSLTTADQAEARAWYAETQLPLIPWSSLAGGFFSGRFNRDNLDTFTSGLDKVCLEAYCYEENFKRLDRTRELAAEKGLTLAQIATAYVFSQPMNIFGLVGCQNGAEFKENMETMELRLTPEEIAWLELRRDSR
jgi:aryl-alcohol dehydrogenase-like predicted oxidoreductase